MKLPIRQKLSPELGWHLATILDVKDKGVTKTRHGEKDMLTVVFRFEDQKDVRTGEPLVFTSNYTKSLHAKAAFTRILEALDVDIDSTAEAFDTDTLKGKRLFIEVICNDGYATDRYHAVRFSKRKRQHAHEVVERVSTEEQRA